MQHEMKERRLNEIRISNLPFSKHVTDMFFQTIITFALSRCLDNPSSLVDSEVYFLHHKIASFNIGSSVDRNLKSVQ